MKKAILLVSFGTTHVEGQKAFDNVTRLTKKKFPEIKITWAFTSAFIRTKMKQKGIILDSPDEALSQLLHDGYTHVAVQSLHTIGGVEFDKLSHSISMFDDKFEKILLGDPLLSTPADIKEVASELMKVLPESRRLNDLVLFIGHGSKGHSSDEAYSTLGDALYKLDANVFLKTLQYQANLEEIFAKCNKESIKRVYLLPFMSVAGVHLKEDIAGDNDKSWKSAFEQNEIECIAVLKGTAEYDNIVRIWLSHLDKIILKLGFLNEARKY